MIFFPNADRISCTPNSAVRFAVSKTGFTSVNSKDSILPESATFSMAKWLSRGELSPGQFRSLLSILERMKLKRFGMKLSSTVSVDGVVHFSLRFVEGEELCASMDVDPITGKLSTQLACS